ncbi:hypothetical protein C5D36_04705 [Rathayibacter sp. AY1C6]|uniref:PP2C family protein-serine/threonine phosphatase n=1 Tax=Rathayibacter sp. AY1C6 TaxID=2080539 RepID=UPI000CE8D9AB|nr:protein phosphatase 2C domain-containing protein [Rathayibacter sp. AY1C6]PPG17173.1 hypothetical protein C5D36_04705 [Rathayibacter sp. AY1C6]
MAFEGLRATDQEPAEQSEMVFVGIGAQVVGRRARQNDSYSWGPRWAVVADGAGEDERARPAADTAVDYYTDLHDYEAQAFPAAFLDAPRKIRDRLLNKGNPIGTTAVAAILGPGELLWLTSVGDSLIALLRGGSILHLSRPHNRANEQYALDSSARPESAASTSLTRMLSARAVFAPDVSVVVPCDGDIVLAVSDGVYGPLGLQKLVDIASRSEISELARVDEILRAAGEIGIDDNATILLLTIEAHGASR